MSEELKTKVNEDNQQEHEDEERALRVLPSYNAAAWFLQNTDSKYALGAYGCFPFIIKVGQRDLHGGLTFCGSISGIVARGTQSFALFISRHDPTTVRATFQNVP